MTMSSLPPVDPRVLGKILLIQTTIHAIPSSESLADFVCRGLEDIPGTTGIAVRIRDTVKASPPALTDRLTIDASISLASLHAGSPPPAQGMLLLGIRTIHQWYGAIFFETPDGYTLEPYRPFLESLANTIALTLENRDHADALNLLNEDLLRTKGSLEMQVRERTIDLVNTNAALAREIEERKRFEKELQQAQKMEAIGTLAGGIAHDFNNILSAIIGFSELAKMRLPEGSEIRGHLNEVENAGRRATELVRQILTFCRQSEEERKPLLMQPIVKEAMKFLRASLPSSIEIVQDIAPDVPKVLADATHIHQVIMNLCTNAYHAMQTGGVLRVSLVPVTLGAEDEHAGPLLPPGSYAKLEVSDTGCGMDPQTIERIFDPYFTTKEKGRGTGLGLSVVHGIVQSVHGHIRVASEPGRGSTFQVYLPVMGTTEAVQEFTGKRPLLRGDEHIWVVDDERSIGLMEKEMLENLGYRVRAFANSLDLLRAFQDQPDGCDLVISDMSMPKMNGAELARSVLAVRPGLPVILCTGFSDTINREQALAMGIRDFIIKPVDFERLGRSVRTILDGSKTALSD